MVPTIVTIQNIDAADGSNKENTDTEADAENVAGRHGKNISNKTLLADRLVAIPAQDKNNPGSIEITPLMIFSEQFPLAPPEADQKPVTPEKGRLVDAGATEDESRINWLQQYAVYNLAVPQPKRVKLATGFCSYHELPSAAQ